MNKKSILAISVLLPILLADFSVFPVSSWEYPDDAPPDTKYEMFGPRADNLLIKLYSDHTAMFDALKAGEIDICDWPLPKPIYEELTTPPYNETIDVVSYGAEYSINMLELNSNNNEFLGNPPDPTYPNPVYPNPMSSVALRRAVAHCVDRDGLIADPSIGAGFGLPTYTIVPSPQAKYILYIYGNTTAPWAWEYNLAAAEAILDAGGFAEKDIDGYRKWDATGTTVELICYIRSDHPGRTLMGDMIVIALDAIHIKVDVRYATSGTTFVEVMLNKNFHMYTAFRSFDVDPTHFIQWSWDNYWHPGVCPNYGGHNNPDFNAAADGVLYSNTQEEAFYWAMKAQWAQAYNVLGIPIYSTSGIKAYSRSYTGGTAGAPQGDFEDTFRGKYWDGVVNSPGFGLDNFFSLLNMHPRGNETGDTNEGGEGNMTLRVGLSTLTIPHWNPIYASPVDLGCGFGNLMFLMYDTLLKRDPYDPSRWKNWLATNHIVGTYVHPTLGVCSKVTFTLGPDIFWTDGTPLTAADVYFSLVELYRLLAQRGFKVPGLFSKISRIIDFRILDPYNFEVLFDGKAIWALSWVGQHPIVPKHVWKPIVEGGDPTADAPDPDLISCGPWRLKEYVPYSHVWLVANRPDGTVATGLPGSSPVAAESGYCRILPFEAEAAITEPAGLEWRHRFGHLTEMDGNLTLPVLVDNSYANHSLDVTCNGSGLLRYYEGESVIEEPNSWSNDTTMDPADDCIGIGVSVEVKFAWADYEFNKDTWWSRRTKHRWKRNKYRVKSHLWLDVTCGVGCQITVAVGLRLYGINILTLWSKTWTFPVAQTTFRVFDTWVETSFRIWGRFGKRRKWYKIDPVSWYGTIKEDIAGSTFYDDTGFPDYPYKDQLKSPDYKVDMRDVGLAASGFGAYPGHERWSMGIADINDDYKVNMRDIGALARRFGWIRGAE